jgi:hypothetical protein
MFVKKLYAGKRKGRIEEEKVIDEWKGEKIEEV